MFAEQSGQASSRVGIYDEPRVTRGPRVLRTLSVSLLKSVDGILWMGLFSRQVCDHCHLCQREHLRESAGWGENWKAGLVTGSLAIVGPDWAQGYAGSDWSDLGRRLG